MVPVADGASGTAYNIGVSLRLHGPLNLQALQGSFDALLARHESLRTTFTHDSRDGGPRQQIAPQLTVAIECRERGVGDEQAQIQPLSKSTGSSRSTCNMAPCCAWRCCAWRPRTMCLAWWCTTSPLTAGR